MRVATATTGWRIAGGLLRRPPTSCSAYLAGSSFNQFSSTASSSSTATAATAASATAIALASREEIEAFKERIRGLGPGDVLLQKDDTVGLARIVLRNQQKSNALSGTMMAELSDVVAHLEKWEGGKAVLLCSEGTKAFCGGADLGLAKHHLKTPGDGRLMCGLMTDTLNRLRNLPIVSVACVDGAAIGGGAELTTACDFRVLAKGSIIHFVQAKMGVSPGWGGGARLSQICDRRSAITLLCASRPVSDDDALVSGLVEMLAEPGETETHAIAFLRPVLEQRSAAALRACKSVVNAAFDVSPGQRQLELAAFVSVWGGRDNRSVFEGNMMPSYGKKGVEEETTKATATTAAVTAAGKSQTQHTVKTEEEDNSGAPALFKGQPNGWFEDATELDMEEFLELQQAQRKAMTKSVQSEQETADHGSFAKDGEERGKRGKVKVSSEEDEEEDDAKVTEEEARRILAARGIAGRMTRKEKRRAQAELLKRLAEEEKVER